MLGACKQTETAQSSAADGVVRDHSLDGQFHSLLRLLVHKGIIADSLQMADPAGMAIVIFLFQLLAGEHSLRAVYDDYMIAAIHMGSVGGLVLAPEKNGSLSRYTTEGLSGGVTFALTFGISLAVLLLIMLVVLSGTSRSGELFSPPGSSEQPLSGSGLSADHSLDSYHPTSEDDNRLLVVVDGKEEEESHYWLLRISPNTGEMTVLSFPDSFQSAAVKSFGSLPHS